MFNRPRPPSFTQQGVTTPAVSDRPSLHRPRVRLLYALALAAAALVMTTLSMASFGRGADQAMLDRGRAIYMLGVQGNGKPLVASRGDGMRTVGADAACVNCHQRSGLGAREGNTSIPPITTRYLLHPRASQREDLSLPYVENIRGDRDPYTPATIARAIREGLNSEGRPLDYLMPHFKLDDADMDALIAYLKSLDKRNVPGVTDSVLHFATIITPDADPVKRAGMLDVLDNFFASKNAYVPVPPPRLASTRVVHFKAFRHWQLHVWQLTGQPSTWQAQLRRHLAQEPVMAVISGLGGKTWAPVHAFCEAASLPCLFPNVEAPPAGADRDFYSLYFSKGVLLEAGLIARGILDPERAASTKRVEQIYRAGDSGEAGANALAALLSPHGIAVRNRPLARGTDTRAVAEAVQRSAGADALVLWLRPHDVAALGTAKAAPASVYLSGLMGGLDAAPLPPGWRDRAHVAYPFGLPRQRLVNVDFARGWFRIRKIPVVDLQVQADTYLACGLLSEALDHMADTFVRDYLVERMQDMLEHRIITGYYPRLSLATGQRFASKGGYLVHFSGKAGTDVVADHGWLVP